MPQNAQVLNANAKYIKIVVLLCNTHGQSLTFPASGRTQAVKVGPVVERWGQNFGSLHGHRCICNPSATEPNKMIGTY